MLAMRRIEELNYQHILDNIPKKKMQNAIAITAVVAAQFIIYLVVFFTILGKPDADQTVFNPSSSDTFFLAVVIVTFISLMYPMLFNLILKNRLRKMKEEVEREQGKNFIQEATAKLFKNYFIWNLLRLMVLEGCALIASIFLVFANKNNALDNNPSYWLAVVPIIVFFTSIFYFFPTKERAAKFIQNKILSKLTIPSRQ